MAMAESELSFSSSSSSSSSDLTKLLGLPQAENSHGSSASSPLSASDLRSLMNRMNLRSQQIKSRLRACVSSQRDDFGNVMKQAVSSLSCFSEIADGVDPILSQDLVGLYSRLVDLVEETRSTNREVEEKRNALLSVDKISRIYQKLEKVDEQVLREEIREGLQSLMDVRGELGISIECMDEDESGVIEEEIRPYALLRTIWSNKFREISDKLRELFAKTIFVDEDNRRLGVQDQAQVSTLLTAMQSIGLLGKTFSKLADTMWKSTFTCILQDPARISLTEDSIGNTITLQWGPMSNLEDGTALALLYSKLLKIVNFLYLYVCCSTDAWMKELGRYLWPRIAEAIISGYLSKAVPNEVSEVVRFQEYTTMTNDFEKALANVGLIPKLLSDGDKLGKFVSDVELHFASKKRDRVMARTQRLLVRADFNVFSGKESHENFQDGKRFLENKDNRTELVFHLESCTISFAAKQLMDIIHGVLQDACLAGPRISVELYHTARDAFLLYSAIVPVKLSKELRSISLEAIIHHNDCLYLAHESLGLSYQYREAFPPELKERCVFVDLFSLFQEMAGDVLSQQIQLIGCSLDEALDQGNGFQNTNNLHSYEMASLAIDQVVFLLEKVRMIWKPIMIPSTYVKSMAFLMTSALDRMASEILSQDDIDMRETEQLRKLIFALEDQLFPLLQSLVDDGSADGASLEQIGRLVPTWCKLLRLAELLDMSLISITQSWESGNLTACGFSFMEVQKLIKAVFTDTELRRESLKKIAVQNC